jgi:hypothetical protein
MRSRLQCRKHLIPHMVEAMQMEMDGLRVDGVRNRMLGAMFISCVDGATTFQLAGCTHQSGQTDPWSNEKKEDTKLFHKIVTLMVTKLQSCKRALVRQWFRSDDAGNAHLIPTLVEAMQMEMASEEASAVCVIHAGMRTADCA